ncbi:hypothetical protein CLM62_16545 [Streptomyces sp. SA15]|uniref:hypothetical protein n=1 Tax=Streptomyces sp. SA15 TaxID=934019 RepID=UPI000BAFBAD7|nr:hypothetical protein [Streptomyces sp. SA15]PAZ14917.1 hypothetical protein CLM62_16545 [Streptomyces sp. SA15]
MMPSKEQNKGAPARNGDPGDLWHAMARLHAAHPEPVGLGWPFERPAARLSIVKPEDTVLSARVELFEGEPVRRLHDVLDTVTRDLAGDNGFGEYALVPDVALELMIGMREELPLHTGHVAGLTQLLRDAIGTIGARSTPGGEQCFHCEGTGRARPLWERSLLAT